MGAYVRIVLAMGDSYYWELTYVVGAKSKFLVCENVPLVPGGDFNIL